MTLANDSDGARVPTPRRAAEELPDLERARELGIGLDDLEEIRTVACLLSRFLGRGHAQSRSQLKAMMTALAQACTIEVLHDGQVEAAPHPELAGVAWPSASSVFRQLGIGADDLEAYWRKARNVASDACFPIEWLLAFFPAALWPAVATLVSWGPERTRVRLEQTAVALAERKTTRERRRRPKGSPLAHGTIDAWLTALIALLDELVGLRSALTASKRPALPLDLLEPWVTVPARPDLREAGVKRSGQDNSGPSLDDVRRSLHELARDYEQYPDYPYHRLRRLLLLSLCALLGPRATALRTASVADFKPDVVGPDGVRRDVLEIRPGKTWDREEVHRLPLPPEIGGWLREWIRITGRKIGDESPLFPGKKPKPGMKLEPLSEVGYYSAVAGTGNGEGKAGSRALIPLNGDPHIGYRPHGLRHTAQQLIQRAAVELKAENPGAYDHLTPEDFSRAVLGHSLTRSVADVYRDLDREKLTFAVVDMEWEILWGEGPTRTGLDPAAIAKSRDRVHRLRAGIAALGADLARLRRGQQALQERSRRVSGDELARALIESHATVAEIEELALERERLSAQLALAEQEFAEARSRTVPLPDDMSDGEHARLLAEALGENEVADAHLDGQLSDELTPPDLADVWGTTEQTINRWTRDGFPRGIGMPWDNSAWIVGGPRSKRLPVPALEQALLSEAQKERLSDVRRRRVLRDAGNAPR